MVDRLVSRLGSRVAQVTLVVGMVVTAGPSPANAQGVRGWVGTTVQGVGLRPLGLDTVPAAAVTVDELGRTTYQGRPVTCRGGVCTEYSTRAVETTVAATQDVSLTAWGFGVQGLSFTTLLRGRARSGGDLVWPRSDDAFDMLLGYAQLQRGPLRVRAGRQELRSGLGFSAFDGAWASWSFGRAQVEAYGGRSLARGLREPQNQALSGLESFIPDESVHLFGGAATLRFTSTSVTGRYQREILADRSGLVSERASVDVRSPIGPIRLDGSLDYDVAFERFGKGHVTLALPLGGGRGALEASVRRYVPYFQLSTIWGFFEPVSWTEAETRASWSAGSTVGVWSSVGWRRYGETGATTVFRPLQDDGWRGGLGARWQPAGAWAVDGSYRVEWGPGAFLSSGDVAVRYAPDDGFSVSVMGTTFQQIEEFRLGDGRALGGGVSGDARLSDRITLSAGASVLRHRDGGTLTTTPWSQTRAWSSLRVAVGEDPGLARRRRAR